MVFNRSAGTKDFSPFVVRVNTGLEHPTSGIRTNRITVRYQHEGELVVARIRPGSRIVTVSFVLNTEQCIFAYTKLI